MKDLKVILLALVFLWFGISGASGAAISLYDWAYNIDGTTYEASVLQTGDPNTFTGYYTPGAGDLPANIDDSGFTYSNGFDTPGGFGTTSVTISGAGSHFVGFFVDHELDEALNGFDNENGSAIGSPVAGQSWEIDEPGYVFGDIYINFQNSALDNTNNVPAGLEDDVSMAMGWDFTLLAGDTAIIDFILSGTVPTNGFYLAQTDPDTNTSIYFSSALDIQPIPEPATLLLLGTGLAGLAGFGRKKFRKQS